MAKTIKLNEAQIKSVIRETIEQILLEHVNEIYNLDSAVELIEKQWTSPDDFWFVYISQRKKDNLQNFVKNHHTAGSRNFGVNFIAYGVVSGNTKEEAVASLKNIKMTINYDYQNAISNKGNRITYLESRSFPLQSVVVLCNRFNARCYMTVNKRSMSETSAYADSLKKQGKERYREFQFAAGRQMHHDDATNKWSEKRPYGIIDCDIDDVDAQKKLEDYLERNNIEVFKKYASHDGMHYILPSRDAERLDFSQFDKDYRTANAAATRRDSDPMVMFKGDACLLLYSACGY